MKKLPLIKNYDEQADLELRSAALSGDSKALAKLIETHRDYIFNIAMKMSLDPIDAEDVTQDIIVKIITNLSKFNGESKFTTWIYRIVVNHILNMKKRRCEELINNFDDYGAELDKLSDSIDYINYEDDPEKKIIIEETMLSCTAGMLLCLSRKQRLIYILSEMFQVDHTLGAELIETSKDNYRQILLRAKKQLVNFMENKCGLINKNNPCRCSRKTKAFIDVGAVNREKMMFNNNYVRKISDLLPHTKNDMESNLEKYYTDVFKSHPYQERKTLKDRLDKLISSESFRETFYLS